ncbi:ribosomal protein L11 methyltransferase [Rhizobium rhizosphaerae]|uniref:Ribosomal protein L11 methyltransferase n=1 Tax=Xaviernesmea rhizosphaerae TaxID=1672749 RepID=A0A1Q9AMD0_9HYPH|nr:50S ribosomal protein L11 methyltransferase [Xaviernesmea rhizosphaerae]OLP56548.1 ribosomal protein L11 methyltransferase [Xaviernesmea rhizosphaerae]OQP87852.1 ribosomal protein L11 methyltransferase [Xaviernesmea rhizosphaerae]
MSEMRLFVRASEKQAERLLAAMTDAFEDEGYAIATMEMDEKADIWEASVYLMRDEEEEIHPRFAAIVEGVLPGTVIETEILPDLDWVALSLEGLKPVRAGRFLVHGSHDRDKRRTGDVAIEIDAGQAFGTGHHGTTAGCLEMIDSVMRARRPGRVLDLGTGSGVLAIAARKLAAVPVLATDIDPVATRVARENIRRNGIASGIAVETAAGFQSPAFRRHGPFDLIIANILARPLMRMAPELVAELAPGGSVILSGILAEQRWRVLAAYKGQRLRHLRTLWRNGWVTIHLDKPARG